MYCSTPLTTYVVFFSLCSCPVACTRYYINQRKDDSSEGRDDSFHSKILLERWRQSSGDIAHLTSFINYFQIGIYGQPEKVGLSSNHTN